MASKKSDWNWTRWLFHAIAIFNFGYAIWGFSMYHPEYVTQETVIALWQIKYILLAILSELFALNYK